MHFVFSIVFALENRTHAFRRLICLFAQDLREYRKIETLACTVQQCTETFELQRWIICWENNGSNEYHDINVFISLLQSVRGDRVEFEHTFARLFILKYDYARWMDVEQDKR